MKQCKDCKEKFPEPYELYFYTAVNGGDGFYTNCKVCRGKKAKVYQAKNVDKILARRRAQYNAENSTDPRKKFQSTEAGKIRINAANKLWRLNNPERAAVYGKVRWAIKKGILVKGACQECADPKASFYHSDYSKPLDVHWLCFRHKKSVDSPFSQCLNEVNNNRILQENTR